VKRKRTIVLGLNSSAIDAFVVCFSRKQRIPQFEILRLDVPTDVCIHILLTSRMKVLNDIGKGDPSIATSCAVCLSYLKLHHPNRRDLIEMLEKFRPFEYLSSNEKRIDYMKRHQAEIVCQLIGRPLDNIEFENVIILDSALVDDAEVLNIMSCTNPCCVRIYGHGPCARRLAAQNGATVVHEECRFCEDRPADLALFLGYETPNDVLVPAVISTVHGWYCPNLEVAAEVAVGSAFLFKLIGYDSISIVVLDRSKGDISGIIRRRGAWSADLDIVDAVVTTEEFVAAGNVKDVVIFAGDASDRQSVANCAAKVFWFCGNDISTEECLIALGEGANGKCRSPRSPYPIKNFRHLLALVYSMQVDKFNDGS
jgi:hypothetical protein